MKISFEAFTLIQEMSQEDRENFKNSIRNIECAACIKDEKDKQKAIEKAIEVLMKQHKKAITTSNKAGV